MGLRLNQWVASALFALSASLLLREALGSRQRPPRS